MASTNSIAVVDRDVATTIEKVMVRGDLPSLSPTERVNYYNQVCQSLGLNPLTRPLEFVRLQGKETLYARKDATDQLRRIHGVSIEITKRERVEDVYIVCAKATDKTGRYDEATGAVTVGNAKGDALANALMKAETKAKRRVTLSICGMGILDESELETIPKPTPVKARVVESAAVNDGIASIHSAATEADLEKLAESFGGATYTDAERDVLRRAYGARRLEIRAASPKHSGNKKTKAAIDAALEPKKDNGKDTGTAYDFGPPPLTDDEIEAMESNK